ncbi:MAG TPA: CHAT domain-containing protein [Crinalium sp.]
MTKQDRLNKFTLAAISLAGLLVGQPGLAQRVVPANDGTHTTVTQNGDRYDISGGQRSSDGRNLFQSLQEFGLSREQIASFQSSPEIRNILTRVVGGNPSVIDGLLQVTGGNSNLFLMNPAGIVFGDHARLDVPAAFTATTATGIGFDAGWFEAIATGDYAALVGDPTSFAFTLSQPGAIFNSGNLSVLNGQNLSLLAGTVVNTGQLSAPGGQITIAAVPGSNLVRLSQVGSALSLEFQPISPNNNPGIDWSTPAIALPLLLTGGAAGNATGVTVNSDGTVQLTGSGITIPAEAGTAVVSGQVDTSTVTPGQSGGTIAVLGDRIGLVSANLNATGASGGGMVLIGGDYHGAGTVPNAERTFVSQDSAIRADATAQGNGGHVVVWADDATAFWGSISARGGLTDGNGGFVEVSGRQTLSFDGSVDIAAPNGDWGTLLLDPRNILIANAPSNPATVSTSLPDILVGDFPNQDITINYALLQGQPGNVILEATNDIVIDSSVPAPFALSYVPGSVVRFTADADNDGVGSFIAPSTSYISSNGRNLEISGASITTGRITTFTGGVGRSGDLTLSAQQDIQTVELFTNDTTTFGAGAGNVTITSSQGNISVQSIQTNSSFGNGGNVALSGDRVQVRGSLLLPGNPSIITAGGASPGNTSGAITIAHAGGPDNIPFTVGSPSSNGTAGSLDAGTGTLNSGLFPVAPAGAVVPAATGISLTSVNAAPQIGSANTLFTTASGQPVTITFADLAANVTDANRDNTILTISAIAPGGTLTRNGGPVTAGSVIVAGDSLVYTPSSGTTGTVNAFSIAAADLNNGAPQLAVSNAVAIRVTVSATPTPIPTPAPTPVPSAIPSPVPVPTPTPIPIASPSLTPTPTAIATPILREPPPVDDHPHTDTPPSPSLPVADSGRPDVSIDTDLSRLDQSFTQEFRDYLGLGDRPVATLDQARQLAADIEKATGARPAFLYVSFIPEGTDLLTDVPPKQDSDQLELLVVTAHQVFRHRIPNAHRAQVLATAQTFRSEVTNPHKTQTTSYLPSAKQLYQWFITPIAADLQEQQITNLVFLPDAGLRSLPFAALHDDHQFLVEQYSIGLTPSLSLTDTRYVDIRDSQILAMGISESTDGQLPLPSVPIELSTLVLDLWTGGQIFLNADATLETLERARRQVPYGIIHLATHADFVPGAISNSYIQLWNERLKLDQVGQLGWNNPPVEMLVLSACRTAFGNEEAELGFAGLAVQTGVKTAVASLWYVNDAATAALMSGFYGALKTAPIKAEALRQAQIAMIHGQVYLENGQVKGVPGVSALPLASGSVDGSDRQLSHPYYWAAFTMVGNPW